MPLLAKYLITAAIVVAVSEIARHSGKLGALITAMPLVAILSMIWMHVGKEPSDEIGSYAWYTLWYVLPTLPMFALVPYALSRGMGFWTVLGLGMLLTLVLLLLLHLIIRRFGVELI